MGTFSPDRGSSSGLGEARPRPKRIVKSCRLNRTRADQKVKAEGKRGKIAGCRRGAGKKNGLLLQTFTSSSKGKGQRGKRTKQRGKMWFEGERKGTQCQRKANTLEWEPHRREEETLAGDEHAAEKKKTVGTKNTKITGRDINGGKHGPNWADHPPVVHQRVK